MLEKSGNSIPSSLKLKLQGYPEWDDISLTPLEQLPPEVKKRFKRYELKEPFLLLDGIEQRVLFENLFLFGKAGLYSEPQIETRTDCLYSHHVSVLYFGGDRSKGEKIRKLEIPSLLKRAFFKLSEREKGIFASPRNPFDILKINANEELSWTGDEDLLLDGKPFYGKQPVNRYLLCFYGDSASRLTFALPAEEGKCLIGRSRAMKNTSRSLH